MRNILIHTYIRNIIKCITQKQVKKLNYGVTYMES